MSFAHPVPEEGSLERYNCSYFANAHGGQARGAYSRAFFRAIARLRAAHLAKYLSAHGVTPSTLLELGPGLGYFASAWLEMHPNTRYMAVETDTTCHDSLRTMGVQVIDYSVLSEVDFQIDLVFMSHVLEHVHNPISFLKGYTRTLRTGGALFIEVPCLDWQHKAIDEPHLLFFDKAPLHRLLASLGFEHIQLSYHGQTITQLRKRPRWESRLMAIRSNLIALGLTRPFAGVRPGLEALADPFERAAVAPFMAHRETQEPAWWLRAFAIKSL